MPWAPHCTVFQSPSADGTGLQCGLVIMSSFLASNGASLNTTCVDMVCVAPFACLLQLQPACRQVYPPDFSGSKAATKALSLKLFGSASLWPTA